MRSEMTDKLELLRRYGPYVIKMTTIEVMMPDGTSEQRKAFEDVDQALKHPLGKLLLIREAGICHFHSSKLSLEWRERLTRGEEDFSLLSYPKVYTNALWNFMYPFPLPQLVRVIMGERLMRDASWKERAVTFDGKLYTVLSHIKQAKESLACVQDIFAASGAGNGSILTGEEAEKACLQTLVAMTQALQKTVENFHRLDESQLSDFFGDDVSAYVQLLEEHQNKLNICRGWLALVGVGERLELAETPGSRAVRPVSTNTPGMRSVQTQVNPRGASPLRIVTPQSDPQTVPKQDRVACAPVRADGKVQAADLAAEDSVSSRQHHAKGVSKIAPALIVGFLLLGCLALLPWLPISGLQGLPFWHGVPVLGSTSFLIAGSVTLAALSAYAIMALTRKCVAQYRQGRTQGDLSLKNAENSWQFLLLSAALSASTLLGLFVLPMDQNPIMTLLNALPMWGEGLVLVFGTAVLVAGITAMMGFMVETPVQAKVEAVPPASSASARDIQIPAPTPRHQAPSHASVPCVSQS